MQKPRLFFFVLLLGAACVDYGDVFESSEDDNSLGFVLTTSSANEGAGSAEVTLELSAAAQESVVVSFTATGTATATTDFSLSPTSTVTFAAGSTSEKIAISLVDDVASEGAETIVFQLATGSNYSLGANTQHTFTIVDNDGPPTVQFAAANSSPAENVGTAVIQVNLSGSSAQSISVDYNVAGTATGGGTDYTLAGGTVNFAPGITLQNLSIPINDDTLDEANETISITLVNPVNTTLGGTTNHVATIADNDASPTIQYASASSNAGEGSASFNITVNISAVSGQLVTANYSVTGGTATGGGTDYTLAGGTVNILAGTTSQSFSITLNNDTIYEGNETVTLDLTGPTNSTLGATTTHTFTINDDDAQPSVQFTLPTSNALESVGAFNIDINLSHPSAFTTMVDYSDLLSGTAVSAGTDYTFTNGTYNFPPGITTGNFTINIVNDGLTEPGETVNFALSNPTNATLGGTINHTFTITDDD